MEDNVTLIKLLERIAVALEKIAASLPTDLPSESISPAEEEDTCSDSKSAECTEYVNDISRLMAFLASRRIAVKNILGGHENNETLDRIALFIGTRYNSVKLILDTIKANMSAGRPFTLSLRNEPQQVIADTTQLCNTLYNIAFLTEYRYQKSPTRQLYATPSTSPRALNFYAGQWLERYVNTQVVSVLRKRGLEFSYLCNIQVSLPNGDDFELDMLFETQGEVFWVEAKTGDYRRHIDKYSKVAKILGLDRSHTFMVLADSIVTDDRAKDLSELFGMTVVRIEKFAEQLSEVLPAKV